MIGALACSSLSNNSLDFETMNFREGICRLRARSIVKTQALG